MLFMQNVAPHIPVPLGSVQSEHHAACGYPHRCQARGKALELGYLLEKYKPCRVSDGAWLLKAKLGDHFRLPGRYDMTAHGLVAWIHWGV